MNLKVADAKREEGFTLIELLVVVIIIGILAAIAIPIFLNQREKARQSAVETTLRSGGTYMEVYYTDDGADGFDRYPTTLAQLVEVGFREGGAVTVENPTVYDDGAGNDVAWCLQASHDGDARIFILDSRVGSPVEDADGCPAA